MTQKLILVVADGSKEMLFALDYAMQRGKDLSRQVALLYVVEPETIEAWGGVERAVMDEAFADARKEMAQYEKKVEDVMGQKPVTFYRKGVQRKVLLELIDAEPSISMLVLAARTKEGVGNPLIQYLTSDKGLRKLKVPLVIVPDASEQTETSEDA